MRRRGKIVRMDRWDYFPKKPKFGSSAVPFCDMSSRLTFHRMGKMFYFSFFRRSKGGKSFMEIKRSESDAGRFAEEGVYFIRCLIHNLEGWCIVTTPGRRSGDGPHFASLVCRQMADTLGIPFHDNAVCCVNRQRIEPEFHLLRPIPEKKVIVFDDIITTGSTLKATVESLGERDIILNLIGINNR